MRKLQSELGISQGTHGGNDKCLKRALEDHVDGRKRKADLTDFGLPQTPKIAFTEGAASPGTRQTKIMK